MIRAVLIHHPRQAKICHLDTATNQKQIVRFDVPMLNAGRFVTLASLKARFSSVEIINPTGSIVQM